MEIEEIEVKKEAESPIKSIRTFSVAILNQKPTSATIEVVNKPTEAIITNRDKSNKKRFKCDFCGKVFRYSSQLDAHRRFHTGDKPFKCDICSKGFAHSSNLKRHRRSHTGERPYECEFCNKAFFRSSHLMAHRRIHTGERP